MENEKDTGNGIAVDVAACILAFSICARYCLKKKTQSFVIGIEGNFIKYFFHVGKVWTVADELLVCINGNNHREDNFRKLQIVKKTIREKNDGIN